jgi:hypothetical protein
MTVSAQDRPRCAYRSPSGRRCRDKASIGWNMCLKHCDYDRARAAAEEIVSNRDRLDTAEGVHAMMARAARALAAGEISPRRAAMFFYGGRAMHFSLRRLREEREKVFFAEEKDVWRSKALADAHHDKLHCEESSPEDEEGEK